MGIRRVVTGHDANGSAVFVDDAEIDPITLALLPGTEFYRLWGADEPRRFPDDGSPPASHTYFPPVGGFRFGLFSIGPESGSSRRLSASSAKSSRASANTSSAIIPACIRRQRSTMSLSFPAAACSSSTTAKRASSVRETR